VAVRITSPHVSHYNLFSGCFVPYEAARFVVVGVPFDDTSTYRAGSRFGPQAIREASINIESFCERSSIDIDDVPITDLGDVHVAESLLETIKRIAGIAEDVYKHNKVLVLLGGEHAITLGGVEPLIPDVTLVYFDAHMDLRDEMFGARLSHATVLRRLVEKLGADRVVGVGTRAYCKEELIFAIKSRVRFLYAREIRSKGIEWAKQQLAEFLSSARRIYVSIDIDVLDPAYAPAAANPEPEGLTPSQLYDLLTAIPGDRVWGIDLTEVSPHYDRGVTAIVAARSLFEIIAHVYKHRFRRPVPERPPPEKRPPSPPPPPEEKRRAPRRKPKLPSPWRRSLFEEFESG